MFVVGGIADVAMWCFLECAKEEGMHCLSFQSINTFMSAWVWPKCCGNCPKACFNAKREESCRKASKFKCGASEFLELYPVVRYMLKSLNLPDAMTPPVNAIIAIFDVLDLLLRSAQSGVTPTLARTVEASMVKAMALHKLAYKDDVMVPKWHAGLHIPLQMLQRGRAWAVFTQERKHKTYKEFAAKVTNPEFLEKSVTIAMLNHQVNMFNEPSDDRHINSNVGFHSCLQS